MESEDILCGLKYECFSFVIDSGFWKSLETVKIEEKMLSSDKIDVHCVFQTGCDVETVFPKLWLGQDAFFEDYLEKRDIFGNCARGYVFLTNTVEEFKAINRKQLISSSGEWILSSIANGDWICDPSLLTRFLVVAFGGKKAQQETIDEIINSLPEFKNYFKKLIKDN